MARARVRAFSFVGTLNDWLEQIEEFVTGGVRAQETVDRTIAAVRTKSGQQRGVFVELPPELVARIKRIAATLNARGGRPVTPLDVLAMMTSMAEKALRAPRPAQKRPAQKRARPSSV